jgi:hypothetical protein
MVPLARLEGPTAAGGGHHRRLYAAQVVVSLVKLFEHGASKINAVHRHLQA